MSRCPDCGSVLPRTTFYAQYVLTLDLRWLPARFRERFFRSIKLQAERHLRTGKHLTEFDMMDMFSVLMVNNGKLPYRLSKLTESRDYVFVPRLREKDSMFSMKQAKLKRLPGKELELAYQDSWKLRRGRVHRVESWGLILESEREGKLSYRSYRWERISFLRPAEKRTDFEQFETLVVDRPRRECAESGCGGSITL